MSEFCYSWHIRPIPAAVPYCASSSHVWQQLTQLCRQQSALSADNGRPENMGGSSVVPRNVDGK